MFEWAYIWVEKRVINLGGLYSREHIHRGVGGGGGLIYGIFWYYFFNLVLIFFQLSIIF